MRASRSHHSYSRELSYQQAGAVPKCAPAEAWETIARACEAEAIEHSMPRGSCARAIIVARRSLSGLIGFGRAMC